MHTEARQILIGWTRQFGPALGLYVLTLVVAVWSSTAVLPPLERTAFSLAPIVPGLAMIWLTVRCYTRSDEFIRFRVLQAASLSAVVVAAFALVYAFLEPLGLPRPSAAWVSNFIWSIFAAQMLRLLAVGR